MWEIFDQLTDILVSIWLMVVSLWLLLSLLFENHITRPSQHTIDLGLVMVFGSVATYVIHRKDTK